MSTPSQPAGGIRRFGILDQGTLTAGRRPILVTPLVHQENVPPSANQLIDKVLIKVVSKRDKSQKVFTLRSIDSGTIHSCDDVRKVIKAQLETDIISDEFDVGIVSSSTVISIRTKADLKDFWSDVRLGRKVMLWCDGLKTASKSKKRKADASDPEEIVESGCESDQDDFLFGQTVRRKKRKGICEGGTRKTCTTVDQTPKGQT